MAAETREVLDRQVVYKGEGISIRALEQAISDERSRQDRQVSELAAMREHNAELQTALGEEMDRLRRLAEQMGRARSARRSGGLRGLFGRLGIGGSAVESRRSIEELLRRQYESSHLRLKEAAEYVDRLEAAKVELYDEVERLGRKILESAENEETAAAHVRRLKAALRDIEAALEASAPSSADARRLQLDRDRTRRLLAEHTGALTLYSTAEERLAKLRHTTAQLAETIVHLQSDVGRYVTAASEKLDLIGGQVQAVGAAADASMVMLELKRSLDVLTESVNHATRFVAETQLYFRENVDTMIEELKVYDAETEAVLRDNANLNEAYGELDVEKALAAAIERKAAAAGLLPDGSGQ